MTTNPFDYVRTINQTKKNLLRDTEDDELAEKEYPRYLVNRAMSYHPGTILHADAINMYPDLPNRASYEFLLNSVRPGKRFGEWEKAPDTSDIKVIMEVYECGRRTAQQYRPLMSDAEVEQLRKTLDRGGVKKPRK